MKTQNTKPIFTLAAVILAIIFILGVIIITAPKFKYKLSPTETIDLVTWDEGYVFPYELEDIIAGNIDTVLIIDIRDSSDFTFGNIPGSENIPAVNLLDDENINILNSYKEDGYCVLLYGTSQLNTNGPWMVLRQLGFSNVKLLLGGYDYYDKWKDNIADTYNDDEYMLGVANFDYAEEAKSSNIHNSGRKAAPVISRKKKSSAVEGGC